MTTKEKNLQEAVTVWIDFGEEYFPNYTIEEKLSQYEYHYGLLLKKNTSDDDGVDNDKQNLEKEGLEELIKVLKVSLNEREG